jgi:hypothetical protein
MVCLASCQYHAASGFTVHFWLSSNQGHCMERIKIAVIGLGYVGLPLCVEFAKKYPTVGFDIFNVALM